MTVSSCAAIETGASQFGSAAAVAWTAGNLGDVRRWLDDRAVRAPAGLAHAYDLLRHGLADESAVRAQARSQPGGDADELRARLTEDVSSHPNARSMLVARGRLRLAWLAEPLCPLYVDEHAELVLPRWLTAATASSLLPPDDRFTLGRSSTTAWLVLEAPVVGPAGLPFVKFASLFARESTGGEVTWRWRGTGGR